MSGAVPRRVAVTGTRRAPRRGDRHGSHVSGRSAALALGDRARGPDVGETLIEVVLTVLITAIAVTALVASLGAAGQAGQAQRNGVIADTVMRNYAEATKAGVRTCNGGPTYVTTFTPPPGFSVAVSPIGSACPAITATQALALTVTGPAGIKQTMTIKVRRQ